jgi:hypothetical protein
MSNNAIVRISEENPTYQSLVPKNREEQMTFYNALENPEEKLSAYINKRLKFTNVYMEQITMCEKDDEGHPIPNTEKPTIKTVLITPDGKGILSTSMGVARSLYTMFQIFGTPDTWDAPMEVIVQQVEIGKNRTFKLKVV